MKCKFCKLNLSYIWRGFEMRFQSYFHRCVSVWPLWRISKCLLSQSQWCHDDVKCIAIAMMYTRHLCCTRQTQRVHQNLTAVLFGGGVDGSPFLKFPYWKTMSPVCEVTDAYVVTTATHADSLDCLDVV